jgi:hypothetical protein
MAALLVTTTSPRDPACAGSRISIFPGGPVPTMFPAATPFWIGYAFVASTPAETDDPEPLADDTRFELEVDGASATMATEVEGDGNPMRRTDFVSFPRGLTAGWHEFAGRWYEGGALILSSRNTIEFVEA